MAASDRPARRRPFCPDKSGNAPIIKSFLRISQIGSQLPAQRGTAKSQNRRVNLTRSMNRSGNRLLSHGECRKWISRSADLRFVVKKSPDVVCHLITQFVSLTTHRVAYPSPSTNVCFRRSHTRADARTHERTMHVRTRTLKQTRAFTRYFIRKHPHTATCTYRQMHWRLFSETSDAVWAKIMHVSCSRTLTKHYISVYCV